MRRTTLPTALLTLVVLLAACGEGSSSDTASDPAGDDIVVEEVTDDAGGDAGAPTGDVSAVVAAIEAAGYTCTPESFAMTSAVRETCLTTSSVAVSAYAWGDAATMSAQVGDELFCTADSGLGELRSVRGDTWAITAFSLSGSSTPETQAAISEVLDGLATDLGGTSVSTPCV